MNNLWKFLSIFILSNRKTCLAGLVLLTAFMGFKASQIQLSYELAKILPKSDPNFQLYESFKQRYGEDGNVMVIGVETDKMYDLKTFQDWYDLSHEIRRIEGIKDVVSNADLKNLVRNDSLQQFVLKPILAKRPTTQAEVDTEKVALDRLPVYKGLIFSHDGKAHLMMASFTQAAINDKSRITMVRLIKAKGEEFFQKTGIKVHYSGMPFVRTEYTSQVTNELFLFLGLAILVTSTILFFFFRSGQVVFFALIIVLMGVIGSVGLIVLFGFKITLLSGLIPPLIVVISVPNAIFILNKYHEELIEHGDQNNALHVAIEKMGQTLFLANLTTAIGFGVFAFTGSALLVEFGIVAALAVLLVYAMSLVFIPIVFSYLAPPSGKHIAHFESKFITTLLEKINLIVHNRRTILYSVIGVLLLISVYGLSTIKSIGYIVDDLPRDNAIFTDLKWVENHFKGVMPFEVNIDAKMNGRAMSPQVLTKIKRMEKEFAQYPEFAQPISILEATKFIYQSYRGGDPKYYVLPPISELQKLSDFGNSLKGKQGTFNGFIDSTKRYTRVSFQMADVGTVRTSELHKKLQGRIDTIFNQDIETGQLVAESERYDAKITGNAVVYALQNDYLQQNLIESTLEAIALIALIMWLLFANWRLIPVAILPSLIPLVITAGLMGYFGIALKPSTILIFSIAFGVSSDGTIYFLTRYKDEFKNKKKTISQAISETILNTGVSMFYTAIILFSGFFIFVSSTFKGTQSLGILVSVTLLMGMICNLILLPAMLMTIGKRSKKGTVLMEE